MRRTGSTRMETPLMSSSDLQVDVDVSPTDPNPRPFVHLHCHSHYSLLDGAGDIGRLVDRAVDHGMNALALTDHGNLHGALEFYRKAKSANINPIIGYEAYIAPGSRFEKGGASSSKDASYHLTLLAKNRIGFRNLIKLASAASLEGFYFKPRIDKEILEKYNEGIVCLSGCVSSEFSRAVIKGIDTAEAEREAREIAGWFHKVFDDRYFIEIMNNNVEILGGLATLISGPGFESLYQNLNGQTRDHVAGFLEVILEY